MLGPWDLGRSGQVCECRLCPRWWPLLTDREGTGASGRHLGLGSAAECSASQLHGYPGCLPLVLKPGASFPWVLGCASCRAELPCLLVTRPQPLLVGQHAASTQAEPWGLPPPHHHREVPGRPSPEHPLPPGFRTHWCPALSKPAWRLSRSTSLYCPFIVCFTI